MADFYNFYVHEASSGNSVEVISDTLTANRVLKLPNKDDTLATLADIGAAGGGSVTSVAVDVPDIFSRTGSPITTSGTIAISLVSQAANTFLGVGNSNGVPTFKALTATDIPSIPFTKLTGTAAVSQLPSIPTSKLTGVLDDSQMAAGTNNSYLQLDSDNNGGRIAWDTGNTEIRLRNSDDSGYVSLRVQNLYVEGDTTVIESETMSVADNKLLLNSDVTGTPTEDSGIEIERGTQNNAFVQWNEGSDRFEAGVTGGIYRLVRENNGTIAAGDVSGNVLTINHNTGNEHPELIIKRTDGKIINYSYSPTNSNTLTIDISRSGSPVGWTWFAKG